LNDNKSNPLEGRYSLQLDYEWSSYRLTTIVAIPLLLSLAIGFWYMSVGDVVTAWTLALYIVTAAAALIALMTIVGSLKDL
jgi:membrane protein YdbS with pleckstrin-like domain